MLRAIYDWTLALAAHRHANKALFGVAFAESSFFPIPPDVMLIPMVLAARARAWVIASICTLGSVLGAILGYAIGALMYDAIGAPLLAAYGGASSFAKFQSFYALWGAWVVFAAAVSFLPFKVATIASGALALNPIGFLLASLVGRGIRFFVVAALLYFWGAPIRAFIDKYFAALSALFIAALLGGFAMLALL